MMLAAATSRERGRVLRNRVCLLVGLLLVLTAACRLSAEADGWCTVSYVNDGDTVTLAGSGKRASTVRYLGIDTPEIDHDRGTAEAFGFEAREFNRRLVLDRRVRLEFDTDRTDRYGRWLAYVFLEDGTFVNQAILAEGYGYCLSKKPNTRYANRLLEAQRGAMQAAKGMWHGWSETGDRLVGNRNSRLFHLSVCPDARKISPKNRVRFDSRWEAFWAGYAPARGCVKGGERGPVKGEGDPLSIIR